MELKHLQSASRENTLPKEKNLKCSLYFGDCLDILKDLPEVDLVLTDPPQFLETDERTYPCFGNKELTTHFKFDEYDSIQEFTKFNEDWISLCANKLKTSGSIYVWSTYDRDHIVKKILKDNLFTFQRTLVWFKNNPIPRVSKKRFLFSHEFILWATKNKQNYTFNWQPNFQDNHSVFKFPLVAGKERRLKGFPQKPVKLQQRLVRISSNEGDTVLDPMMGLGSTGVASLQEKRSFIGIEKDKKIFDIAVKWFKEKGFNVKMY